MVNTVYPSTVTSIYLLLNRTNNRSRLNRQPGFHYLHPLVASDGSISCDIFKRDRWLPDGKYLVNTMWLLDVSWFFNLKDWNTPLNIGLAQSGLWDTTICKFFEMGQAMSNYIDIFCLEMWTSKEETPTLGCSSGSKHSSRRTDIILLLSVIQSCHRVHRGHDHDHLKKLAVIRLWPAFYAAFTRYW